MKSAFRMAMAGCLGLALVQVPARAQDTNKPATFKDDREKASYALGLNWGGSLKRANLDLDIDVVAAAVKDVLAGREAKLTDQQAAEAFRGYQAETRKKVAEKNKKEGEAFLAENKKKEGIKTQSVPLPDGTQAEFQYKVITEGSGAIPKSNDVVIVKYRATTIGGKEVDNSDRRPGPAKIALNRDMVRGRAAALQMMKLGSKWELYLPSSLGVGDNGPEPGATVIFEVESVSIDTPPPPSPTAQPQAPLTSDIIRVPSAEELKKGAKVEVMKPEDVEKQIKAAAATNQPAKPTKD